jgi:hypothetical protein
MEDGTTRMMKDDFYYWKAKKKGQHDLLFIVGDHQGLMPDSHYKLSGKILDVAEAYGSKTIYTLGGFGVGRMSKKPRVYGAVTDLSMKAPLEKLGVSFEKTGGGIVGAAGLLIGMGKLRKMQGLCLMGETHGQIIDARSAKAVLEILNKMLCVKIDLKALDKKGKETEQALEKARKLEQQRASVESMPSDAEVPKYIR